MCSLFFYGIVLYKVVGGRVAVLFFEHVRWRRHAIPERQYVQTLDVRFDYGAMWEPGEPVGVGAGVSGAVIVLLLMMVVVFGGGRGRFLVIGATVLSVRRVVRHHDRAAERLAAV